MGYTSSPSWNTKADVVASILRDCDSTSGDGSIHRVLKHSVVGNNLWLAYEVAPTGRPAYRFVDLFLMSKEGGEWAHKEISEAQQPYYYDCPKAIIDTAGPATDAGAQLWRDKWQKLRTAKQDISAAIKSIAIGDLVEIDNGATTLRVTVTAPKILGDIVGRNNGGRPFRLPLSRVNKVTKAEAAQ